MLVNANEEEFLASLQNKRETRTIQKEVFLRDEEIFQQLARQKEQEAATRLQKDLAAFFDRAPNLSHQGNDDEAGSLESMAFNHRRFCCCCARTTTTKPIQFSDFKEMPKMCHKLAVLEYPRTQYQPDRAPFYKPHPFDPLSPEEFLDLETRFKKLISYRKASLNVFHGNLKSRTKMKFVSAYIARHRPTEFNFSQTLGFKDANAFWGLSIFFALRQLPRLRRIEFDDTMASPTCACACAYVALKVGRDLSVVNMKNCKTGDVGAALWGLALFTTCRSLETLNLSFGGITDVGARALSLGLHNGLIVLDLQGNSIGRIGIQQLGRSLRFNSNLEELNLNRNQAGSRGAASLAAFLMHPECQLKILHLEYNDVGYNGGKALSVGLARNRSLLELSLAGNDLEDVGSAGFGLCLAQNTVLLWLNLSDCDVTSLGLAAISLGLEKNATLTRLTCRDSVISCSGCERLAQSLILNLNSALMDLDLSMNLIRDSGALELAKWIVLPSCRLSRLHLNDNDIGNRGTIAIAEALRSNAPYSLLTLLDLSGNPISTSVGKSHLGPLLNSRNAPRLTRLAILFLGIDSARRNLRGCGVLTMRYKMKGCCESLTLAPSNLTFSQITRP